MKVKSNEMGRCPKCNSDNLDYGAIQFEGDMCYFPWTCEECGQKGEEWYEMNFAGHNLKTEEGNIILENNMIESECEE